jgi:pimeloyl-ACP methyl ester carboxylesterase
MESSSRPGTFTAEDWTQYREAWSQPDAFKSMVHWYRAALRAAPKTPANLRIHVPTLLIWGARDRFLRRELAEPSVALCDRGRLEFFDEATHWIQHEEADKVNELILEHLAG